MAQCTWVDMAVGVARIFSVGSKSLNLTKNTVFLSIHRGAIYTWKKSIVAFNSYQVLSFGFSLQLLIFLLYLKMLLKNKLGGQLQESSKYKLNHSTSELRLKLLA